MDFIKQVESGIIDQHSIGFNLVKTEKGKTGPRYINEVKLFEGSALTFLGANENTPLTGLKSFDIPERLDQIGKAYRSGEYEDDESIELEFMQLKQLFLKHISQPAKAVDSLKVAHALENENILKEIKHINKLIRSSR